MMTRSVVALAVAWAMATPSARAADWQAFDLSNAARLSIRIQNQLPLGGEYRIAPDGTVSIPVVGRLSVIGKQISEFESELAGRISEITRQDGYVAAEIAEYKPLYVSGFVNRPGAIPWAPDLTVGQAVAVAGGLWRPPSLMQTAPDTDVRSRQQKTVNDLKWMLASLARLQAERSGAETLETPPELLSLVGEKETARLMAAQTSQLESGKGRVAEQVAALERGKANAEAELSGLREQSKRIVEQLAARQQAAEGIERLQVKGLIPVERGLEQRIKILELEEKSTNIAVSIARIQSLVSGFERDIITAKKSREAEIESDSAKLDKDIAAAKIEIASLQQLAAMGAATAGSTQKVVYGLTRGVGRSIHVDADEALRPGDVLEVHLESVAGEPTSSMQPGQ